MSRQADLDDRWPEIQETLRIEEALEELGIEATVVRGDEWFAHCPLPSHSGSDSNPSFSVNTDKMLFSCFTCGTGGTPIKLVMQVLGVDYEEALDWLAQFSDFTVYGDAEFLEQVRRKLDVQSEPWRPKDDAVLPWYPVSKVEEWNGLLMAEESLWRGDELMLDGRCRHIGRDVARYLQLGYSPEHRRGSHVGPALIIPVFVMGQCVGWQERWLGDRPDWVPKYTNTSDFPRAHAIYGAEHLVTTLPVIVVESPLTRARLLTAGYLSVATFGAKVSPGQLKLLRLAPELWLSMDNDLAGQRAVKFLTEALDAHTQLWVVPPPEHEDKADLGDCNDALLPLALDARVPAMIYGSRL